MHLCTGRPTIARTDDRFVITFPSGESKIEMALTLHELTFLSIKGRSEVQKANKRQQAATRKGEVVPFERRA